jgi:hypothetical protein
MVKVPVAFAPSVVCDVFDRVNYAASGPLKLMFSVPEAPLPVFLMVTVWAACAP